MTKLMLPALACMLAAAPAAAAAQDADADAPVQPAGATAVSLNAGGGYAVGLWRQLSPRARAGVEVGAYIARGESDGVEQDRVQYSVSPTLKLFSSADGPLRPYTLLAAYVEGSRQQSEFDEPEVEYSSLTNSVGARVGAGLEWMPVRRVAVGGHVGVGGGYTRTTNDNDMDEEETTGWSASTFTSGIVLTLFF